MSETGTSWVDILQNILSLQILFMFRSIWKLHSFLFAKPYGLANQRLCYFQINKII